MSAEGVTQLGWVREDRAHDTLVKALARRVIVEGASWEIEEHLDNMWSWAPELEWTDDVEPRGPGGRKLGLHGKVDGEPLAPEARMFRRFLHACDQASPRPQLVILARDGDRRATERRRGFEQVIAGLEWRFTVILAMPEPESEAWFSVATELVATRASRRISTPWLATASTPASPVSSPSSASTCSPCSTPPPALLGLDQP